MIIVVGPTASGKTDLALALARELGGELVSADSRQIYREPSAGTARPVLDAQGRCEGVPCHLVGFLGAEESYDAGRFAREARRTISGIQSRGRVPIVVGGTGLYLRALLEGLAELPPRNEAVRNRLLAEARSGGRPLLHQKLARVDPEAAAAIPPNNIQRVIRALEVHELTGKPISSLWKTAALSAPPLVPDLILRLDWPLGALRSRIEERARLVWPAMLDETRGLLSRFQGTEPGFQSLGYPEAVACLQGRLSSDKGLAGLISATHSYARRQRTWFRGQIEAATISGAPVARMLHAALQIAHAPSAN